MLRLITLCVAAALTVTANAALAAPIDDARSAYQRGDFATALSLLQPMAEQGNADAQFGLGALYANGQGVPLDNARAYLWLNLAASSQSVEISQNAAKARDAIAAKMTRGQIAEATNAGIICRDTHYQNCSDTSSPSVQTPALAQTQPLGADSHVADPNQSNVVSRAVDQVHFIDTFKTFSLGSTWGALNGSQSQGIPNVSLALSSDGLRMTSVMSNSQVRGITTLATLHLASGEVEIAFKAGAATDPSLKMPGAVVGKNIDGLIGVKLSNPESGEYLEAGLFAGYYGASRYFYASSTSGKEEGYSPARVGPGHADWDYQKNYKILFRSSGAQTDIIFEAASNQRLFVYRLPTGFDRLGAFNIALFQSMGVPGGAYYTDAIIRGVKVTAVDGAETARTEAAVESRSAQGATNNSSRVAADNESIKPAPAPSLSQSDQIFAVMSSTVSPACFDKSDMLKIAQGGTVGIGADERRQLETWWSEKIAGKKCFNIPIGQIAYSSPAWNGDPAAIVIALKADNRMFYSPRYMWRVYAGPPPALVSPPK